MDSRPLNRAELIALLDHFAGSPYRDRLEQIAAHDDEQREIIDAQAREIARLAAEPETGEMGSAVGYLARVNQPAPPAPDAVREAAFAQFGRALLPLWWDDGNPGDIDGSAAQDAAEASGLWRRVERHADGVECEWCNNEEPCGELTDTGLAALRGGQKGGE